MKLKILESAKEDLKDGFHFYEFKEIGIDNYFCNYSAPFALSLSKGCAWFDKASA
ncbi:MAG: hypothetical protein DDT28_00867 [Dehalococcoidia bacterium]|nr:hypothetical protein [Chloroflexota bacterium]